MRPRCLLPVCLFLAPVMQILTTVMSGRWLMARARMRHSTPYKETRQTRTHQLTLCRVLLLVVLATVLSPSPLLLAQEANARVSGIVTDPSKAVITGVNIVAVNIDTNVRFPTKTNGSGIFVLVGLPIGDYRVEVDHIGFKSIVEPGIVLHTQDALELNFEMALGSASETVTVSGSATNDSPAVSMTVDREFVENMPLNGRSVQDLIQLAPGTVSDQTGYYSIDGQRNDANNFTVDGVSANLGGFIDTQGGIGLIGGGLSGSAPLQTALGTTQSLASIDSLQEFTIQTSGYSAEYGRNPGGQFAFATRSGANDVHGTLFDYFRNEALDANTYANNFYDQPKTAERQNDFGGTIGGPIVVPRLYDGRNRTFYFFSYEGLRLKLPSFENEHTFTEPFREWASPNVRPFLNALPLPSPNAPAYQDGCTIPDPATGQPTDCDATFAHSYSNQSSLDSISVRLDHNFGQRFHAFLRYADTPSWSASGAEVVNSNLVNSHSWTAGLTANLTSRISNETRFNFTHDGEQQTTALEAVGGSVPWPRSLLIPAAYEGPYTGAIANFDVPNVSELPFTEYFGAATAQHQYQVVDNLTWTHGLHSLKFGADWRRLTPVVADDTYQSGVGFDGLGDIQQGTASFVTESQDAPGEPVFDNLSLFVQDHWRLNQRLALNYGLRWEFNPPPGPARGLYPITLTSDNLATAVIASPGTPPYKTLYDHFAPRLGFAWSAIPAKRFALTLRGGFGIFFDTAQQTIGSAYVSTYPFYQFAYQLEVPLPLSPSILAPPPPGPFSSSDYPYGVASPNLTSPYTEQWTLSLDEALTSHNTLTASYVGNNGKRLLFTQIYYGSPDQNPFFSFLEYTSNASQSSYNALQIQDTGRLASGLDLVGSFTYAHARDNASADYPQTTPFWGNSSNDLRRVLNLAINYQTPVRATTHWTQSFTHGWLVAARFSTQSGYPMDIYQADIVLPNGSYEEFRPDLVSGVPLYLHGHAADYDAKAVPGNWRLNPAAFASVPTDSNGTPIRQGALGRNYVRNPPFYALNTSAQRSFGIYENLHLNFRVDAFNILNHPSLSNPDPYLGDSTFGELVEGSTTRIGSSNSLYSMGAARSLQLSLRLQF